MLRRAARVALLVSLAATASADAATITSEREISERVLELTIDTPSFAAPTKVEVILPKRYERASRLWPATYFTAGTMNSQATFRTLIDGVGLSADYPSIIVSPDSNSGYWSDWYNAGAFGPPRYETFVVDELIPLIERRFRVFPARSQRVIFGASMGGYGALMLAARHPGLFAAAASMSGAVDSNLAPNGTVLSLSSTFDGAPADAIYGPRSEQEVRWRGHNPWDLAENLRGLDLQVRTANGVPAPGIGENPASADSVSCAVELAVYQASVSLHARLDELGIAHDYTDYGPGCHTPANFTRETADILAHFERVLAAPPAAPARFVHRSIRPRFTAYGWRVAADPERALEFLELKAQRRAVTLTGSGRTTVTTPRLFRGVARVDVDGRPVAVRGGRVRFAVDLGPAHTVQQYTPGAAEDFVTKKVTLAPHPVGRGRGRVRGRDALPRLEVDRGDDAAIVDARGRQVLLRGINVNQLGDYYQADTALPTVMPLSERDFRRISRLGFNVVRLVMSWSAYQPEPGAFDAAYVARVRRAVRWAAEYDLYVVLDMHQDAWGKHIATPEGETCPPGTGPAVGWDGAPLWATLTDGLSTCRLNDTRELAPAVAQAFESFYTDREGIQTELVATWGRIAEAFASESNVVGYDLINEPHPGLKVGVNQAGPLGNYYDRAIDAIRAGERAADLPNPRIAFFEPSVLWSGFGTDVVPPPDFTDDPEIVFAPHLYAESITIDGGLTSVEEGFENAADAAATYGAPLWSGEWGWFGDPLEARDRLERYLVQEDARRLGGAWWVWKQACGDPHVVGYPGASGSLNPTECPSGKPQGLVTGYTDLLRRAYPRFAPGRLTALESDWESGRWSLTGRAADARSCRLQVWVPGRAPRLRAERVARLRVVRRPGGHLVRGCARGDYALSGRPPRRP